MVWLYILLGLLLFCLYGAIGVYTGVTYDRVKDWKAHHDEMAIMGMFWPVTFWFVIGLHASKRAIARDDIRKREAAERERILAQVERELGGL